jgi:DNA-binding NtrC family response regulator
MTKKILIVDDEVHFRFAVSVALRKAGYKIGEANNAEDALEMILDALKNNAAFDLMLLDIQMPGMFGIKLLNELIKNNISIPLLVITGFKDEAFAKELQQKEFSDFLYKPFEPKDMLKMIDYIFQNSAKISHAVQ